MEFQFDSLSAFLHMQGHGFYVWLAYGLSLAVLVFIALYPVFRKRSFIREQAKQQQLQEQLQRQSHTAQQGQSTVNSESRAKNSSANNIEENHAPGS